MASTVAASNVAEGLLPIDPNATPTANPTQYKRSFSSLTEMETQYSKPLTFREVVNCHSNDEQEHSSTEYTLSQGL